MTVPRLLLNDRRLDDQMELLERVLRLTTHDVANDMAAVMGWLELSSLTAENRAQAAQLMRLHSAAEGLIGRLRRRAGALRPPRAARRKRTSVSQIVDAACQLAQADLPAPREVSRPRRLPSLDLEVDLQHCAMGLAALVANAFEASATPPVLGAREGEFIELSVRDTGIGADAATLARCGEPFFTAFPPSAVTHWGLGIASAYRCASAYGGGVMVSSAGPDRGFEAVLLLPRSTS